MELKKINETVSVSPQIAVDDMAAIKTAGFRAIICNRPDGESVDQPGFAAIAAAASAAGIETRYVPIMSGAVTDSDIAAFGDALANLPQPVLAYCRSGTRSATLWAVIEAGRRPMTEIVAATQAAGYDVATAVQRIIAAVPMPDAGPTPRNRQNDAA